MVNPNDKNASHLVAWNFVEFLSNPKFKSI